jgi:hypothetical protein
MRAWRLAVVLGMLVGCAVAQKGTKTMKATGTFEVKMGPTEPSEFEKKAELGRYTVDKVWHGDFEGTSVGEMVSAGEASTGAMAYVAIEKMSGKLAGKSGTFLFTHAATMMKSDPKSGVMRIEIVPGSGTGELKGITGKLTINIDAAGKHSWVLEYELP